MTDRERAAVEFERWLRMAAESAARIKADRTAGRALARDDVERRDRYVGYALALIPTAFPEEARRVLAMADVDRVGERYVPRARRGKA